MKKIGLILLISGFWLLVSGYYTNTHAQDDTLTLLTWYPAPYGVYQSLEVVQNSASATLTISAYHNTAATSPTLTFRKARGTMASPSSVTSGHILGTINFQGHEIFNFETGARIYAQASADWGASERSTELRFQTRQANSALATIMYIEANGHIGILRDDPPSLLTVYEDDESTTQTNFTQSLTNAGINILTDYITNAYTPGIFWSTQNNNNTRPKAGVYLRETNTGSNMYLGTSNAYATGITSNVTIDPNANMAFNNMPAVSYNSDHANYFIKDWASFVWDDNNWDDIDSAANWANIFRLTVTIPSNGYLLVQATGDMMMSDSDMPNYRMAVGISEVSSGTPPAGARVQARVTASVSEEKYPYAVSRVYSVTPETKNFYVVGFMDSVNGTEPRFQVTGSIQAIFFPVSLETSTYNY